MAIIVDGKKIALEIKNILKAHILKNETEISFHIIYIGSDSVIDNFIKYKEKFGRDIGVNVVVHRFDADIDELDLHNKMREIIEIADSVIVQLPLPKHISTTDTLNLVPANKDVDVLGLEARTAFAESQSYFFPPVTGSIVSIFKHHSVDIDDKNIVIIGDGALVGKPTQVWLDRQGKNYFVITKETNSDEKQDLLKKADIIISGAGEPNLVQVEDIKEGVILIDAGTSESGKKIIGDISPHCAIKATIITPVPGGIGPITIAVLYQNILRAYLDKINE